MESKAIPLDYIRALIVAQGGRCAITGVPLNPQEVNADHIIPLSRSELSPSEGADNIWLVHKRVNAMKGALSYDEFLHLCKAVIDHHAKSVELLRKIGSGSIEPMPKATFDLWVSENCSEDGTVNS